MDFIIVFIIYIYFIFWTGFYDTMVTNYIFLII